VVENPQKGPLRASKPSLLEPLPSGAVRWMPSSNHYLNWLESIRGSHDPIAPIEQSARALEACSAAWIGMKLGRKLTWDPKTERFVNDDAANAMLSRKPRKPEYDIALIMKKAGLA
jgi:myo-inositol 2-dehydrogenase / D-chiro-inositol 1-dehydrogenase